MTYGVKAGWKSSETKSYICRSDTYLVIRNIRELSGEVEYILVITASFSSA